MHSHTSIATGFIFFILKVTRVSRGGGRLNREQTFTSKPTGEPGREGFLGMDPGGSGSAERIWTPRGGNPGGAWPPRVAPAHNLSSGVRAGQGGLGAPRHGRRDLRQGRPALSALVPSSEQWVNDPELEGACGGIK